MEKCRFIRNFLWIIAEIGVFLVWKNAERHVGKKNIAFEVKSGKDYARHRALNNILDCSEYNIPESVVLCKVQFGPKRSVI